MFEGNQRADPVRADPIAREGGPGRVRADPMPWEGGPGGRSDSLGGGRKFGEFMTLQRPVFFIKINYIKEETAEISPAASNLISSPE